MGLFKKVVAILVAIIMVFCTFGSFAQAASPTITKLEITKLPNKLTFYQGTDWDYGFWNAIFTDDDTIWSWKPGSKISFLLNPGSPPFPERGMIDMTGLEIKITYSDGKTKTVVYKETIAPSGVKYANIYYATKGGKDFVLGKNTLEVYVTENVKFYDTYEIEIVKDSSPKPIMGDVDNNGIINSSDALLVLQHSVRLITLTSAQKTYADLDNNGRINSSDALAILRKSVDK